MSGQADRLAIGTVVVARVAWVLRFMWNNGGSPMAFFQKFITDTRLDFGSNGIAEMQGWCKFFEIMILYDQLDPSKLACAELGARRIQIIAGRWKAKLPGLKPVSI